MSNASDPTATITSAGPSRLLAHRRKEVHERAVRNLHALRPAVVPEV